MTDMLDLITLLAGIGIGWLMGRARGTSARCSRYCARCGSEWTEAGA